MYGSDVSVAVKVAEAVQRGTEAGGALLFTPTPFLDPFSRGNVLESDVHLSRKPLSG